MWAHGTMQQRPRKCGAAGGARQGDTSQPLRGAYPRMPKVDVTTTLLSGRSGGLMSKFDPFTSMPADFRLQGTSAPCWSASIAGVPKAAMHASASTQGQRREAMARAPCPNA